MNLPQLGLASAQCACVNQTLFIKLGNKRNDIIIIIIIIIIKFFIQTAFITKWCFSEGLCKKKCFTMFDRKFDRLCKTLSNIFVKHGGHTGKSILCDQLTHVGCESANCWPTTSRHFSICRPLVGHQLAVSRPLLGCVSAVSWLCVGLQLGFYSISRNTVCAQSDLYQPVHHSRPVPASTSLQMSNVFPNAVHNAQFSSTFTSSVSKLSSSSLNWFGSFPVPAEF